MLQQERKLTVAEKLAEVGGKAQAFFWTKEAHSSGQAGTGFSKQSQIRCFHVLTCLVLAFTFAIVGTKPLRKGCHQR